jgi:rare lipoprotein A
VKSKVERRKSKVTPAEKQPAFHFRLPPSDFRLVAAALLAATLAGCGSTPSRDAPLAKPPRSGGYYLDDGPGANPPANLDAIPDAVPRTEPLRAATTRPYTVMGRAYTPMTTLAPYKARGIASWYGRRYHGKMTSSGEIYDMYAMTAAHTTLPIPSYARVTHLASGKSVVVRINDRGPFVDGRVIDLSYTAAYKLGVLAGGSAMVEVETLIPGAAPPPPVTASAAESEPIVAVPPVAAPPVAVAPAVVPPVAAAPAPVAPPPAPPSIPVTTDAGRYYLQLGAFASRQNAESFLARVQAYGAAANLQIQARDQLYRVHAGPYSTEAGAREAASQMGQALGVKPMVLTR